MSGICTPLNTTEQFIPDDRVLIRLKASCTLSPNDNIQQSENDGSMVVARYLCFRQVNQRLGKHALFGCSIKNLFLLSCNLSHPVCLCVCVQLSGDNMHRIIRLVRSQPVFF